MADVRRQDLQGDGPSHALCDAARFAGGSEGFGVANVPDEAALHRMMIEWPLAPFLDLEVRPVLTVDEALAIWFDESRMVAGQ